MNKDIKALVRQMTLEEKASLCSGLDSFKTKPIKRLDIPSISMFDGPNGLRKEDHSTGKSGLHATVPATCFPPAVLSACSWDRELLHEVGVALGEECIAEDIDILLGPSINIKRSPLCGRNFEYYSEDPYLTGELAAQLVDGVQSNGIGSSIKHFALNNQESRRMTVSADVDERTMREIYLAAFERIIKKANPWTIMCAYNKVNGECCSENKHLLTDILRDDWNYEGFVLSDWGAVNDRVKGVAAGLELEMPGSGGVNDKRIVEAVKNGSLDEKVLDQAVTRILNVVYKAKANKKPKKAYDKIAHHKLARKVAAESIVLLKNNENILPLKKEGKVAVIGAFAKFPRYQGDGSSYVNATMCDDILKSLSEASDNSVSITYADGYRTDSDEFDKPLYEDALTTAKKADCAVIFTGLPQRYECEGQDRDNLSMPQSHIKLIEGLKEVQKNLVVVLCNGVPIEMPWKDSVPCIVEGYLGGQGFGSAISDILFGNINPSGKLAETFPKRLADTPSYLSFPGQGDNSFYQENIFVGYRYYDTKCIEPLFPFGYGLSYTQFDYDEISADKNEITDGDTLTVSATVKNIGNITGKETVELYVRDLKSTVKRPDKELKGFEKIELKPGESKTVSFKLCVRDFSFYDTDSGRWLAEEGKFQILIGKSSRNIELSRTVSYKPSLAGRRKYNADTLLGDIKNIKCFEEIFERLTEALTADGMELHHLKDCPPMLNSVIDNLPLRSVVNFSGGVFSVKDVEDLLEKINA